MPATSPAEDSVQPARTAARTRWASCCGARSWRRRSRPWCASRSSIRMAFASGELPAWWGVAPARLHHRLLLLLGRGLRRPRRSPGFSRAAARRATLNGRDRPHVAVRSLAVRRAPEGLSARGDGALRAPAHAGGLGAARASSICCRGSTGAGGRPCCSICRRASSTSSGLVFWPQDFIFLTWLLIIAALSLFFFTAVGGPAVVRLRLPADRVDRGLPVDGALDRGRPARTPEARRAPVERAQSSRARAPSRCCGSAFALWTGFTFVGFFTPIRTLAAEVQQRSRRAVGNVLDLLLRLRHLRQCRLSARAGLQVHVSLCALPERDVRPGHADHHLRRRARRAARRAQARHGCARARQGRLHRLHDVRAGLSHRHRHPQGPADRVHRLRGLHRRLRRRHGQDGLPARPHSLHHRARGRITRPPT